MTLVFQALGEFQGFEWALRCALAYAECKTVVIGDNTSGLGETIPTATYMPDNWNDL